MCSKTMVQPSRPHFLRQTIVWSLFVLLFNHHQNNNAITTVTAFQATSSSSSIPPTFASSSHRIRTTVLGTEAEDTSNNERFTQEEKGDKNIIINQAKQALFQSFAEQGENANDNDNDDDESSTTTTNTLLSSSSFRRRLHMPTKERTALVADMTKTNPTPSPGSTKSFSSVAPGIWRVVYAPHIATFGIVTTKFISAIFSILSLLYSSIILNPKEEDITDDDNKKEEGSGTAFSLGFDPVYYLLRPDGTMTSHARLVVQYPSNNNDNNPPPPSVTWFSVAGTYSSQDEDRVCRVDFDEAWVVRHQTTTTSDDEKNNYNQEEDPLTLPPYSSLEKVPDSLAKTIINALGKFFFIDAVSVFPVSYLDDDCIVFDFELLGTRILAKKVHKLMEGENDESNDDAVLQFLVEEEG